MMKPQLMQVMMYEISVFSRCVVLTIHFHLMTIRWHEPVQRERGYVVLIASVDVLIDKALEFRSQERPLLSNDSQHLPHSLLHTLLTSIESLDVSCKLLEVVWLQHLKYSQINTEMRIPSRKGSVQRACARATSVTCFTCL